MSVRQNSIAYIYHFELIIHLKKSTNTLHVLCVLLCFGEKEMYKWLIDILFSYKRY